MQVRRVTIRFTKNFKQLFLKKIDLNTIIE